VSLPAAVLFDMDGTLIDSEPLWFASEVWVMDQLGSGWTNEDQSNCLGGPLDHVAEYMKVRSGSELPPEEIGVILMDRMEHLLRSTPLAWRPGAPELLREVRARELPTALVSASWARLIAAVSDRIDDELGTHAFDTVVAGDHVVNSKPHPEPYLTAAARLGAEITSCLAVEDSPTGVRAAIAAGCRVVAVQHLAPVAQRGAAVVESLSGRSVTELWELARVA
jgi:HAD superfamily hydrolase (TIGR01509 family)